MPYCRQCLIEYVEGTARCEECDAALLPGSPPEASPMVDLKAEKNVKLVLARIFSNPTAQMDAELAQNILQTQGIPSALSGEGLSDPLPVSAVHLLVREEDLSNAERLLQEYFDTEVPFAPSEPEVPEPGEER